LQEGELLGFRENSNSMIFDSFANESEFSAMTRGRFSYDSYQNKGEISACMEDSVFSKEDSILKKKEKIKIQAQGE
jgi:hypothetical protein